jgi:hypothetical protein
MARNMSPVPPTFAFRAVRPAVDVRLGHFLVPGEIVAGEVRSGSQVWVHVPGGATEAKVVEIVSDGSPLSDAQIGQQVALLLRGGRTFTRIITGTGISDSPNNIDPPPPPTVELRWEDYKGPVALEWLRTAPNGDDNAFASNRFQGTEEAIWFVETLYAAGAVRVIINQDNIVDEGRGDLYADALVLLLPQDPAAYSQVVKICKQESDREEGSVSSDAEWENLGCVFLWWD